MRIKLLQTGTHAPWQVDEIVTVQVVAVDDVGAYECETLETYPPDMKQIHALHVASVIDQADQVVKDRETRLATALAEVVRLTEKYEPSGPVVPVN